MIRYATKSDTEIVIKIWLEASLKAHDFVDGAFWSSKVDDMRELYLPNAETYVLDDGVIKGFFSLHGDALAAIFISPEFQGQGIGRQLMTKARQLRDEISLNVYAKNENAVGFYKKLGFEVVAEGIQVETGEIELVMKWP